MSSEPDHSLLPSGRFSDGADVAPKFAWEGDHPYTFEAVIERFLNRPLERGEHVAALKDVLTKHALNEWAIRCWSGSKNYDDPHRRLVEMLRTREWALNELASIEVLMEPLHPVDKRSPSSSLRQLLTNPPEVIRGIQQITDLMNRYGARAGEKLKHTRLPFFARLSLFIKKLLNLEHGVDYPELPVSAIPEPEPVETTVDRYKKLLEGPYESVTVPEPDFEPEFLEPPSTQIEESDIEYFRKRLFAAAGVTYEPTKKG